MDVSSLSEDNLLLTNKFNLHRCKDCGLKTSKSNPSKEMLNGVSEANTSSPIIVKERMVFFVWRWREILHMLCNIPHFIHKVGEQMVTFLKFYRKFGPQINM